MTATQVAQNNPVSVQVKTDRRRNATYQRTKVYLRRLVNQAAALSATGALP